MAAAAPFERREVSKEEALGLFEAEPYKQELIRDLPEDATISVYQQGEFLDLCRGPHVPDSGRIGAAALLSVAGAYWRGKSDNTMLTRIYGTAFPSKKELEEYLERLEMARQRDHRRLGRELGLFSFHEEGPGFPFFHPEGHAGHQRPARLLATGAHGRRLRRDQDADHAGAHLMGAFRPLGELQGQHVFHPYRRRRFRGETHELSRRAR